MHKVLTYVAHHYAWAGAEALGSAVFPVLILILRRAAASLSKTICNDFDAYQATCLFLCLTWSPEKVLDSVHSEIQTRVVWEMTLAAG